MNSSTSEPVMVVKRTALKRRTKAPWKTGEVGDEPKDLRVVVEDRGGPARTFIPISLCTANGIGYGAYACSLTISDIRYSVGC